MTGGRLPTGLTRLDRALGGGLPPGLVALTGAEGGGKTDLALALAAAVQRRGPVALVDTHPTMGMAAVAERGVEVSQLVRAQASCGGQALAMAAQLAGSGGLELVIVDAVGAVEGWGLADLAVASGRGWCCALVIGHSEPFESLPLTLALRARARLHLDGGSVHVRCWGHPCQRVALR